MGSLHQLIFQSNKPTKTVKDDDGELVSEWNPEEEQFSGSEIKEVELFYAGGDVCDITGKPREVVVRLKVKLNAFDLDPNS